MPPHLTLAFLSVVTAASYALHSYLGARLAPLIGHAPSWANSGTLHAALSALVSLYFITGKWINPRTALGALIAWSSALWMSLLLSLTLCAALHHLALTLAGLMGWAPPWWLGLTALAFTLIAWALGVRRAVAEPALREVEVRVSGLPEALRGLTILQLSDLHVGPTLGRGFIERLVARARELSPDVIAVTGDLVDGSVALLGRDVAPLFELSAPCGVFFVTGNHELISGAGEWVRCVREGGVRVLENEQVVCERGGVSFVVVGVEDWEGGRFPPRDRAPSLSEALEGAPSSPFVLLLAHQPKAALEASARGVSLQLSGHTHGGQLWPFTWLIYLDQPYRAGLYWVGQMALYVSEGTGYWGPPLRWGTRGEVTLVRVV